MKKKEMINEIILAFRSYELEMIVPVKETDSIVDIGMKIEQKFNEYKRPQLSVLYKAAKVRRKYMNVGLIA